MNDNVKTWISRSFAGFITLTVGLSAFAKVAHVSKMVDGIMRVGITESAIVPIAVLELTCLTLYLIPRTMVLGAVLLTGFFGGAIVVHIIGKESIFPLILIGVLVWGGIYFRVPALQRLLPLRNEDALATGRERPVATDATKRSGVGAYRAS
jgi:hypothetical protein